MKRIIASLLCAFMLIGVLSACGKDKEASSSDVSASSVSADDVTADDSIFSTEKVNYVDADGKGLYRIIRPDGDAEMTNLASNLFKQFKAKIGSIKNQSDQAADDGSFEILIGNTNRPESAAAIKYLKDSGDGRYKDFIVCTIGKKIVINAMSSEALTAAVDYFIENFVKPEGIEGGIKYIKSTAEEYAGKEIKINGISISKFNFVRDNTSRSWLIQEEIRKAQDTIRNTIGFDIPLLEDTKTTEGEYEIVVGNAARTGVPTTGNYDEYAVAVSGKKVYLYGGTTYSVQVAVTEFAKLLSKSDITDADSKTGSYLQTVSGYDSSTYYRHVWGDEFNESTLDTKIWHVEEHKNYIRDAQGGLGKNGPVDMVVSNETQQMIDGNLVMRAFYRGPGEGYLHHAGIQSRFSMTFNKGYLEMRARIADGKGVYSSFWCTGEGGEAGGLEIDIFESLGVKGKQQANVHFWKPQSAGGHTALDGIVKDRYYTLPEGTLFDQYRTVSLLWTDSKVDFYYDGELYYTQATNEFFIDKYLYVIAGFNVGWGGRTLPDDDLPWPLEYHIDYIRLYQVDGDSFKLK